MSRAFVPIKQKERNFLPADFKITDWESLQPYFEELKKREIADKGQLMK